MDRKMSTKRSLRIASVAGFGLAVLAAVAAAQDVGVFVASKATTGNLGGLAGADAICQELAAAALPKWAGPWVAMLSDSSINASDRIPAPGVGGAYVRASDPSVVVAIGLQGLMSGSLRNPILLDEAGERPPIVGHTGRASAWTGTSPALVDLGNNCSDWTDGTESARGIGGASEMADSNWTAQVTAGCDLQLYLYCFGQQEAPPSMEVCRKAVSEKAARYETLFPTLNCASRVANAINDAITDGSCPLPPRMPIRTIWSSIFYYPYSEIMENGC